MVLIAPGLQSNGEGRLWFAGGQSAERQFSVPWGIDNTLCIGTFCLCASADQSLPLAPAKRPLAVTANSQLQPSHRHPPAWKAGVDPAVDMRYHLGAAAHLALVLCAAWSVRALPQGMSERTLLQGLALPVSARALPDGRVLVAHQSGKILIVTTGANVQSDTFMTIDNVDNSTWHVCCARLCWLSAACWTLLACFSQLLWFAVSTATCLLYQRPHVR